jgi:hypothetical protein
LHLNIIYTDGKRARAKRSELALEFLPNYTYNKKFEEQYGFKGKEEIEQAKEVRLGEGGRGG